MAADPDICGGNDARRDAARNFACMTSDVRPADEANALPAVGDLNLSGHIARTGDAVADGAGRLGAGSLQAIEGFRLDWPGAPHGTDIVYGCTVGGLGTSLRSLTGGFVGTRGQARPVTGIWAEVLGSAASDLDLEIEAEFAGAGRVSGRSGDCLSGDGPEDILVALSVRVVPRGRVVVGEREPSGNRTSSQ